ncbi:unnamed protein product [Closterium sp. Naga37s-1]|nr:unnamed protein product [Closterium sp. Naga37s-1]
MQVGRSKARSSTVYKNLNPTWNEEFLFRTDYLETDVLLVTVWDEDYLGKADFLGQMSVPVAAVAAAEGKSLPPTWYPLKKKSERSRSFVSGESDAATPLADLASPTDTAIGPHSADLHLKPVAESHAIHHFASAPARPSKSHFFHSFTRSKSKTSTHGHVSTISESSDESSSPIPHSAPASALLPHAATINTPPPHDHSSKDPASTEANTEVVFPAAKSVGLRQRLSGFTASSSKPKASRRASEHQQQGPAHGLPKQRSVSSFLPRRRSSSTENAPVRASKSTEGAAASPLPKSGTVTGGGAGSGGSGASSGDDGGEKGEGAGAVGALGGGESLVPLSWFDGDLKGVASKGDMPAALGGGVLVEQWYGVPAHELNGILFKPDSDFYAEFTAERKVSQLETGPWIEGDAAAIPSLADSLPATITTANVPASPPISSRVVRYMTAPSSLVKSVLATELMRYSRADAGGYLVEVYVATPDVPYGNTFRTEMQFCITPSPDGSSCQLRVSWAPCFLQSTMMKGMIENGMRSGLKDTYTVFQASTMMKGMIENGMRSGLKDTYTVFQARVKGLPGVQFLLLDLPDGVMELLCTAVIVLSAERALFRLRNIVTSRLLRRGDHGKKAEGEGWLLTVTLVQGEGVGEAGGVGGKSDPYVVFTCNGKTRTSSVKLQTNRPSDPYVVFTCNGKTRTSSVKLQTNRPVWNEVLSFDAFEDPPSTLDVEIFDYDGPFSAPTALGQAEVDLVRSSAQELSDLWVPLQGGPRADARKGGKAQGQAPGQGVEARLQLRVLLTSTSEASPPMILERISKQVGKELLRISDEKNTAFHNLFDLPDNEPLINDFSCALKKNLLSQGRLFLSPRLLAFHASLFRVRIKLAVRWEDIDELKENAPSIHSINRLLNPSITIYVKPGRGGPDTRSAAYGIDPSGRLKIRFQSFARPTIAFRRAVAPQGAVPRARCDASSFLPPFLPLPFLLPPFLPHPPHLPSPPQVDHSAVAPQGAAPEQQLERAKEAASAAPQAGSLWRHRALPPEQQLERAKEAASAAAAAEAGGADAGAAAGAGAGAGAGAATGAGAGAGAGAGGGEGMVEQFLAMTEQQQLQRKVADATGQTHLEVSDWVAVDGAPPGAARRQRNIKFKFSRQMSPFGTTVSGVQQATKDATPGMCTWAMLEESITLHQVPFGDYFQVETKRELKSQQLLNGKEDVSAEDKAHRLNERVSELKTTVGITWQKQANERTRVKIKANVGPRGGPRRPPHLPAGKAGGDWFASLRGRTLMSIALVAVVASTRRTWFPSAQLAALLVERGGCEFPIQLNARGALEGPWVNHSSHDPHALLDLVSRSSSSWDRRHAFASDADGGGRGVGEAEFYTPARYQALGKVVAAEEGEDDGKAPWGHVVEGLLTAGTLSTGNRLTLAFARLAERFLASWVRIDVSGHGGMGGRGGGTGGMGRGGWGSGGWGSGGGKLSELM